MTTMTETDTDRGMTESTADGYARTIQGVGDLAAAVTELRDRGAQIDRRHLWGALGVVLAGATDAERRRDEALYQFDNMNDGDELNDGASVGDLWLRDALDIYFEGRRSLGSGDGWSADKSCALLGFGGPNVRLCHDFGEPGLVLTVDWWGSHAERRILCDELVTELDRLADEYAEQ